MKKKVNGFWWKVKKRSCPGNGVTARRLSVATGRNTNCRELKEKKNGLISFTLGYLFFILSFFLVRDL